MEERKCLMLLNFTAKNYKTFADEMNFSMIAAPRQTDLNYSLFKEKIGGKDFKVQCSSVVYGANASGKSNIISAMDTFKSIILRGNIKGGYETSYNPNWAADNLEFIPNKNNSKGNPVKFFVEFIDGQLHFAYNLSFYTGEFLHDIDPREILTEELYLNDKLIFSRSGKVKIGEINKNNQQFFLMNKSEIHKMEETANNSLNKEELFLTNGFKVIFSSELVKLFTNWISQKFIVVYRADSMDVVKSFSNHDIEGTYLGKTITKAAKIFGVNFNTLIYINNPDNVTKLCSYFEFSNRKGKAIIPAEVFESYGTIRFINLFPLVLKAFDTGATLVADEFDASIHPSALMNIINLFHNDSINKNHAQLIFNTHNPIFLNSNLFRRDEIKFVQRDHDTGNSELYSLSDFGTSGKKGVRNATDYMKYYLNYSYGAIEDVDFTPVFESIVNNDDTGNKGGE